MRFLGVWYQRYDPVSKKLYVSQHVFLERIPFFTILSTITPISKDKLMNINPFPAGEPCDEFAPAVNLSNFTSSSKSTSPLASPSVPPFSLVHSRKRHHTSSVPATSTMSDSDLPPLTLGSEYHGRRYTLHTHNRPNRLGFSTSYCTIHSYCEPQSYQEACADPNRLNEMEDELAALHKTGAWDLVPFYSSN